PCRSHCLTRRPVAIVIAGDNCHNGRPELHERSPVHIVADENIPLLNEFFADIGTITRVPGRTMTAADLATADILLVRSVTRVDEALLAGTPVTFGGAATKGTDHIDLEYVQQASSGFKSAPGYNAQEVEDYLLRALSVLVDEHGLQF